MSPLSLIAQLYFLLPTFPPQSLIELSELRICQIHRCIEYVPLFLCFSISCLFFPLVFFLPVFSCLILVRSDISVGKPLLQLGTQWPSLSALWWNGCLSSLIRHGTEHWEGLNTVLGPLTNLSFTHFVTLGNEFWKMGHALARPTEETLAAYRCYCWSETWSPRVEAGKQFRKHSWDFSFYREATETQRGWGLA